MSTTYPASLAEQIAEVKRECGMRESVYGRWVADGRLSLDQSRDRIRRMRAALATLERLKAEEDAAQPGLGL